MSKYKFNKETFNNYNILGKLLYLFSISTHIPISFRDIYTNKKYKERMQKLKQSIK